MGKTRPASVVSVQGGCVCGAVRIEIGVPARWAWHDHSAATRHAQGAAYATYVGSWRSRFRILDGEDEITRFEDPATHTVRSFCARCGTPIAYERPRAPQMVNVPRAILDGGTEREPRYHIAIDEVPEWAYGGGPLVPLKGFPGVVWEWPRRSKRRDPGGF